MIYFRKITYPSFPSLPPLSHLPILPFLCLPSLLQLTTQNSKSKSSRYLILIPHQSHPVCIIINKFHHIAPCYVLVLASSEVWPGTEVDQMTWIRIYSGLDCTGEWMLLSPGFCVALRNCVCLHYFTCMDNYIKRNANHRSASSSELMLYYCTCVDAYSS